MIVPGWGAGGGLRLGGGKRGRTRSQVADLEDDEEDKVLQIREHKLVFGREEGDAVFRESNVGGGGKGVEG